MSRFIPGRIRAFYGRRKHKKLAIGITAIIPVLMAGTALAYVLLNLSAGGTGQTNVSAPSTISVGGGSAGLAVTVNPDGLSTNGFLPGGPGAKISAVGDSTALSNDGVQNSGTYVIHMVTVGPPYFTNGDTATCKSTDLSIAGLTAYDPNGNALTTTWTTGPDNTRTINGTSVPVHGATQSGQLSGDNWTGAQLFSAAVLVSGRVLFADNNQDQSSCEGLSVSVPVGIS